MPVDSAWTAGTSRDFYARVIVLLWPEWHAASRVAGAASGSESRISWRNAREPMGGGKILVELSSSPSPFGVAPPLLRGGMAEQAFGSFTHYGESADKGSWMSSLAASSAIYVVIGLLVLSIPVTKHVIQARKPVEIKFVERVVKAPPPVDIPQPKIAEPKPLVAPPTQVITRPKAPAAAAPIVRPDQKIRRVDKPPPPKKLEV